MELKIIWIEGKCFSNNTYNLVVNGGINVQASSFKYGKFKINKLKYDLDKEVIKAA